MSSYNNNIRKSRPSSSSLSSAYARPRSVYSSPSRSSSSSLYSSIGLSAPYQPSPSYSSTIPSYSPSTYGGTASGYGGLTITPSSSSSNFSLYTGRTPSPSSRQSSHASPSTRQSLYSVPSSSRQSHAPLKRNYYQSPLSRFDSSNSLASSKSYGSEGYASGGDSKTSPLSRLCSKSSSQDSKPSSAKNSPGPCSENGEIDYKALYEEVVVDNERLRRQLQKTEEDLLETKITIEKQSTNAGKSTLSETEKRERRAMERKLSEMEEELKQMEQLRLENQRLKDENGALIRVISKLSK